MSPRDVAGARRPRCPTCGQPVTWRGNDARPFCSIGCKLVDLGTWRDERYRVPGESVAAAPPADDRRPSDR